MDRKEELQRQRAIWRNNRLLKKQRYRKNQRIEIRTTANEKAYMKYMADRIDPNMTLTEYIIESALYGEVNLVDLKSLAELTVAINHLGNNINQISRKVNTEAKKGTLSDDLFKDCTQILNEYQQEITNLHNLAEKYYRKLKNTLVQKDIHSYKEDIDYRNELKK